MYEFSANCESQTVCSDLPSWRCITIINGLYAASCTYNNTFLLPYYLIFVFLAFFGFLSPFLLPLHLLSILVHSHKYKIHLIIDDRFRRFKLLFMICRSKCHFPVTEQMFGRCHTVPKWFGSIFFFRRLNFIIFSIHFVYIQFFFSLVVSLFVRFFKWNFLLLKQ